MISNPLPRDLLASHAAHYIPMLPYFDSWPDVLAVHIVGKSYTVSLHGDQQFHEGRDSRGAPAALLTRADGTVIHAVPLDSIAGLILKQPTAESMEETLSQLKTLPDWGATSQEHPE